MRKSIWVAAVLAVGVLVESSAFADSAVFEKVVERVLPTVVKLSDTFANKIPASPKPEDQPNKTFGSGVVIDAKQGLILTNEHVVKEMKSVRVTFNDGRTADTTQLWHDADTDLAVVKLAARDAVRLQAAEFADSDNARVLQPVVAIGSPFDLPGTATYGHISALHRRPGVTKYEDFLQTDAAINPGSSGGPLFDEEGKILGIVTAIRSKSGGYSGIAFVIPANLAKGIAENLARTGKVPRAFLGVRTEALTPAERTELKVSYGVRVIEMPETDAPSKRAGLQVGDIILKVAGVPVLDPKGLVVQTTHLLANRPVALAVVRDGKPDSLSTELWALTDKSWPLPDRQRVTALGLWGQPVSEAAAGRYGYASGKAPKKGFLITDLEADSLAQTADLKPGSVILQVERVSVGTAAEVQAELTDARLTKGVLLVQTDRSGRLTYTMVFK